MMTLQIDRPTYFIQRPEKGYGDLFVYTLRKQWLSGILEIEAESSENFWGRSDFENLLKDPSIKGYVAVKLRTVTGFVMYEKKYDHFNIINLGVHKDYRRRKVGSLLMSRLKNLLDEKRNYLTFDVRETNLPTQLFLRNNGFLATGVVRDYFKDYWFEEDPPEVEDAFSFRYEADNAGQYA